MTENLLWMLAGAAVASVVWVALLYSEAQATLRARREQRLAEEALDHTRRALDGYRRRTLPGLPTDPVEVRRAVDHLTGAEVWDGPESAA